LKSEPDNLELLANKALTLHAMDNYVSAIELYKEILAKKPNERIEQNLTAASIAYGYSLCDKKDYGQAILYFEDALDLNPKEASAYFGYAMANEKIGCTDIALENYRKAVSLAPGNSEYVSKLNAYTASFQNMQNAEIKPEVQADQPELNIITPVVTAADEPMSYDKLVSKGDEAYKKQDYGTAVDYYTKAVVYKPSDKVIMQKIANIYKQTGKNEKALSFYDKIIALDSENSDAYFNKGLVYAGMKDYDKCISCFEKVIQLSPDYPYAYYSIGMAYEQKGMKDQALQYYYLYSGLETDPGVLSVLEQKIKRLESK
jgi:tetratricopeptide (TPR) repeat protein